MKCFFIPSADIVHPETLRVICEKGKPYQVQELSRMAALIGFDYAGGVLCFAVDFAHALQLIRTLT